MYEAHKWKIGEEITSEKLNHIEKGIEEAGLPREITNPQDGQTLKYDAASGKWVNGEGGSGGGSEKLVVHVTETTEETTTTYTLDKTWKEIDDSFPNVAFEKTNNRGIVFHNMIDGTMHGDGFYGVNIAYPSDEVQSYETDAETGYPTYTENK